MTRRGEVPSIYNGVPLTFAELPDAEISRSRIRASDVAHPFHGVHVVGREPDSLSARCQALAAVLRPSDAFSHVTAASLLGAPMARARDQRIHVTTLGGTGRIQRPGVVGHRAESLPLTLVDTLPVVAPAHVFTQLATMPGHDDLVAVGDYLVTPNRRRKSPPLTTLEALQATVPARARGARRARTALADVRMGAESRMESLLRLMLIRAGLPEPILNPAIRIGDQTLHPDLLYPQWRVALEYEGDHHRTDPRQWRHDIWRGEVFASAGWRVIRVVSDDILKQPEAFLARVCRELAQRQRI